MKKVCIGDFDCSVNIPGALVLQILKAIGTHVSAMMLGMCLSVKV